MEAGVERACGGGMFVGTTGEGCLGAKGADFPVAGCSCSADDYREHERGFTSEP